MKNIRNTIFETNSSSVHAICIAKDPIISFPGFVKFGRQMFGREEAEYYSIESRASYLYEAILAMDDEAVPNSHYYRDYYWSKVQDFLTKNGIRFEKDYSGPEYSQIDHGYECEDFVREVCENEDLLAMFLFGTRSKIQCGGDEQIPGKNKVQLMDEDTEDYKVFIKGN